MQKIKHKASNLKNGSHYLTASLMDHLQTGHSPGLLRGFEGHHKTQFVSLENVRLTPTTMAVFTQLQPTIRTNIFTIGGMILGLALMICLTSLGESDKEVHSISTSTFKVLTSAVASKRDSQPQLVVPDWSSLSFDPNCTVTAGVANKTSARHWTTKPLLIVGYMNSGANGPSVNFGNILMPLSNMLTPGTAGCKQSHVSAKGRLKSCHSTVMQVSACTGMGASEKVMRNTVKYDSRIVLVIRDLQTTYPAMFYDKDISFHEATSQAPENSWRRFRDQFFVTTSWAQSISEWKSLIDNSEYYNIAMVVQYEKLIDPTHGPKIVQRLGKLFQSAGFESTPLMTLEDAKCIWYQVLEIKRKEWSTVNAFYKDYRPGFTPQQRDFMVETYRNLTATLSDPEDNNAVELVSILNEYIENANDENIKLDIPWQNITKEQGST
jgi:hypothetical protein